MIDHFTKYLWLYALKNKQAEDVLECLSLSGNLDSLRKYTLAMDGNLRIL